MFNQFYEQLLNFKAELNINFTIQIRYKSPTTKTVHTCDMHVQMQKTCMVSDHPCTRM